MTPAQRSGKPTAADSWEEVERFGRASWDWLRRFLDLPNGILSHDTFYRVAVG
jgi:hypothetical protein